VDGAQRKTIRNVHKRDSRQDTSKKCTLRDQSKKETRESGGCDTEGTKVPVGRGGKLMEKDIWGTGYFDVANGVAVKGKGVI